MGRVIFASQTPTITTVSAYATGNALGSALAFSNLLARGSGVISSVVILDHAFEGREAES